MKSMNLVGIIVLGILAGSVPANGHHSFAAVFDANDPVDLTGDRDQGRVDEPAHLVLH